MCKVRFNCSHSKRPDEDLRNSLHPRRRNRKRNRARNTFKFEFENFGWGGDWYRSHGEMMPANGLDALRKKDAILFGSAGDPDIPEHITLWGLRLKIC